MMDRVVMTDLALPSWSLQSQWCAVVYSLASPALPHVTVGKPLSSKGTNNNNSCCLLSAYSIGCCELGVLHADLL